MRVQGIGQLAVFGQSNSVAISGRFNNMLLSLQPVKSTLTSATNAENALNVP